MAVLARFPGLDETGLGEKGLTATLRSRYSTIIRRFNDAIEAVRPAPGRAQPARRLLRLPAPDGARSLL